MAESRTLFVIAYRISSVKDCDQILVMQGGKIIERGTHDELVKAGGYYASVFHHQYGEFEQAQVDRNNPPVGSFDGYNGFDRGKN